MQPLGLKHDAVRSVEQRQMAVVHRVEQRVAAFVDGQPFFRVQGEHPLDRGSASVLDHAFVHPQLETIDAANVESAVAHERLDGARILQMLAVTDASGASSGRSSCHAAATSSAILAFGDEMPAFAHSHGVAIADST